MKYRHKIGLGIGIGMLALFTACMGEGGHIIRYSSRKAVVQETPWKSLYVTDDSIPEGYLISSVDFEGREDLKEGDCCVVEYKVDFSQQYKDGVYQADILRCDTINKYPLLPVMTDTSAILENEQFTELMFAKSRYMKGRFFVDVQFKEHQDTRQDFLELSYNPVEELVVGDDGIRVYNLYLRAWKNERKDSIPTNSLVQPVAFVLEDFVEKTGGAEKDRGNEDLKFVINYPQRFNTDTTACIWAITDTVTIRLN